MLNPAAPANDAAAQFGLGRVGAWRRLLGRGLALANVISGRRRYDAFRLEWIQDVPLLVVPSVFNPKLPRTGAFLASRLESHLATGTRVLDLGTGSGVCAVFAARIARQVLAVDINPAAVRCARINALLNDLGSRIEVREGDLFTPVLGQRFDRVLFNPPFLRGLPRDDRDRAWRSEDVPERFAAQLAAHLRPGGYALVLLSSYGGAAHFLHEFARRELAVSVAAERRYLNERIAVLKVQPPPGAHGA